MRKMLIVVHVITFVSLYLESKILLGGKDGAKSGPLYCEPMGTISRQNSGRVQQMTVDPSGTYLAVLVSRKERESETEREGERERE